AGFARCALAWRAVGAGLEMDVAEAAVAALGQQRLLTVLGQIDQHLPAGLIAYDGTDRYAQHQVLALGAVAIRATTILASLGAESARVAVIHQSIDVLVGLHIDGAATAAIAATGAAHGLVFFTTKRRDT